MTAWFDSHHGAFDRSARTGPGKARVLLVDDDPAMLLLIRIVLETAGYEVKTTADPQRVCGLLESFEPDAVLLDLLMPDVSGWEILESIRGGHATRTLPVLLLSSIDQPAMRVRGLRAGADDFMVKPPDPEELLIRLSARIGGKLREESGMFGCLGADWTARDLLQSLECHGKTGELKIYSENLWGTVLLRGGKVVAARCGPYYRRMAVQALLELRQGHFTFSPKEMPRAAEDEIRVGPLVVEEAWIHQELDSRGVHLPPAQADLELRGPLREVPAELEDLPVEAVYQRVSDQPNTLVSSLFTADFGTPNQVRLAIAWMIEEGIVGLARTAGSPA